MYVLNNSGKDYYYQAPMRFDTKKGVYKKSNTSANLALYQMKVRNASTIFQGTTINFYPDLTHYETTDNNMIYVLKKGHVYSKRSTFTLSHELTPEIGVELMKTLSDIEEYDNIVLTRVAFEGKYLSDCGEEQNDFKFVNYGYDDEKLLQTPVPFYKDELRKYWIRVSNNRYVSETNSDELLIFNPKTKTFIYTSIDGKVCNLKKVE